MTTTSVASSSWSALLLFILLVLAKLSGCISGRIALGSRLLAKEKQAWVSDNGTFAFGFTRDDSSSDDGDHRFQLAIWFAQLPGDLTLVWSAYL